MTRPTKADWSLHCWHFVMGKTMGLFSQWEWCGVSCFIYNQPEHTIEQALDSLVTWDAVIMQCYCNAIRQFPLDKLISIIRCCAGCVLPCHDTVMLTLFRVAIYQDDCEWKRRDFTKLRIRYCCIRSTKLSKVVEQILQIFHRSYTRTKNLALMTST